MMKLLLSLFLLFTSLAALPAQAITIEIVNPTIELRKQAEQGDLVAIYKYGTYLERGLPGVPPDYKAAEYWLKIAAQQGHAEAILALAELYDEGKLPEPSKGRAKELYEYAYRILIADAEKDRASAATSLGAMFFHGRGVKPDASESTKWFQRAIDLGSNRAKLAFGRLALWNTTPGYSAQQALQYLYEAAESGMGGAWMEIGRYYSGAFGGRVNHPRSVEAFRAAHESGSSHEGSRLYGISFLTGFGNEQNYEKAAKIIEGAARRGNAEAMYNMAMLYRNGKGVPRNKAWELAWLRKASEYKIPDADYYLALAYRDGDGVPKSKTKALEYFEKAQIKKHVLAVRDYNKLAGTDKSAVGAPPKKSEPAEELDVIENE
jgi:TPR repeat protein